MQRSKNKSGTLGICEDFVKILLRLFTSRPAFRYLEMRAGFARKELRPIPGKSSFSNVQICDEFL